MEGAAGEDHDRRVDEQREASASVESIVAKRIASRGRRRSRMAARLHDRRVQIEVVRHHRRADDADGEVQHRRNRDDARAAARSRPAPPPVRLQPGDLEREADADRRDQGDDRRLEPAKAAPCSASRRIMSRRVTRCRAVMLTPNSRCSPIATPITSARSQATIATSQNSQQPPFVAGAKWRRHACARSTPSLVTLSSPISAVERTCVPPHSSRDQEPSPISTMRTMSPYFSPKSAVAPSAFASSSVVTIGRTESLPVIHALTGPRPRGRPRRSGACRA